MKIIIEDSTPPNNLIDIETVSNIYKIYKAKNVSSYEHCLKTYKTWKLELYSQPTLLHIHENFYFILEMAFCLTPP